MTTPTKQNIEAAESVLTLEDANKLWHNITFIETGEPKWEGRLLSNAEIRMLNGQWVERNAFRDRRKHWSLSPWAGQSKRKSDRRINRDKVIA